MNITFVTETDYTDTDKMEVGRIIIDGIKDNVSTLINDHFYIESEDTFIKLKQASIQELKNFFSYFSYSFNVDWSQYQVQTTIAFLKESDIRYVEQYVLINFKISYIDWSKLYTLHEFIEVHRQIISESKDVIYDIVTDIREEWSGNFFGLKVIIENTTEPVYKYVDFALEKLKEVHLLAIEILNNKFSSDSISVLYQFPQEIRAACNQYLMYFAQFLQDLGISAKTSLKEQANQVLFTVTPKDKRQALDVIYKALAIYIEASNEEISKNIIEGDLAIMQWKANIFHLRSQLELAKAMLQAKDETI